MRCLTFELSGGEAVRLNEGLGVTDGEKARYGLNATDSAAARRGALKTAPIFTERQRPQTDYHLPLTARQRRHQLSSKGPRAVVARSTCFSFEGIANDLGNCDKKAFLWPWTKRRHCPYMRLSRCRHALNCLP